MCCRVWKLKTGALGPPHPKKWPFFAQKWPTNANFGPETVFFWARAGSSNPPHPILQVPDANKHVLQGMDARKWVIQGRATQKSGHFLPKNGLKMLILGQIHCFLGLGSHFKVPPLYFSGA